METIFFYEMDIGTVGIAENGEAITGLYWNKEKIPSNITLKETPRMKEAARQLIEYLQGKRKQFDLVLQPEGTEFQKKVWQALQTIPYGQTRSYGQVAAQIGNPKACRAVGMANNRNPISIFIPCHRVIGSDGTLVGYGGGLDRKEKLLRLEGVLK